MPKWNSTQNQWSTNKIHARENRRQMSQPEKMIWAIVSGKQMNGVKFRCQHSIGPYLVDFYCPELKLVLEIDGWSHDDTVDYDRQREDYIQSIGFHTYHIQVDRVLHNREDVRYEIEQMVMVMMEEKE